MCGHFSGQTSSLNNEVTLLPRWPKGGVPLYLGVFYSGLFSLKSCSLSVLANFLQSVTNFLGPLASRSLSFSLSLSLVWPWNENARTKQKQQTNGNKAIWLVYRTDTNAPGFWLVKRTLGWKTFMPEELSRNCFDVILQYDWSIEQCLSILGFSLAVKQRRHVLIFLSIGW